MRLGPLLLLPVLALGLAACSGGSTSPSSGAVDRLLVATTVSPITSIAAAVAEPQGRGRAGRRLGSPKL